MKVRHDKCGAPVFELSGGTWIHAFPATVYHVERFIWESAPDDFAEFDLDFGDRAAPAEVDPKSASKLWARNLTAKQSVSVARWLGGRLPTRTEWTEASNVWASKGYSAALQATDSGDARIGVVVGRLAHSGVVRRADVLDASFCEFATEYRREPFGTLHLLSAMRAPGVLTDSASKGFRDADTGFCCVFERSGLENW